MNDRLLDLLIEFDEMGFAPTTVCEDPEAYAKKWKDQVWEAVRALEAENAALINEADENAALSMENKQRADRLEAENAALRERIENAVDRLKAREQSVCFGWEWKAVVTDKDINEVFGVTE